VDSVRNLRISETSIKNLPAVMPPKNKRRQAILPKRDADAALDIELGEIDLKVDEMKAAIEKTADATIAEMKRVVETAILKLPTKIKNMKMKEFMTEFKGEVAMVLEQDKKQNR
jgi:Nbl1 / Borealin N terminal